MKIKNVVKEVSQGVLAGIMISIAGIVYLSCENKYIGALLFSVGLISIVMLNFNLYTGKVGYIKINDASSIMLTINSLVGNIFGCLLVGLAKPPMRTAIKVCNAKLSNSYYNIFLNAVFCGILIYICVDIYKRYKTSIGIIFCIPAFVLSGFEHSIADTFYFVNARVFTTGAINIILTAIIGNAIGSLLIAALQRVKHL